MASTNVKRLTTALGAVALAAGGLWWALRAHRATESALPRWPDPSYQLRPPRCEVPTAAPRRRVLIDAGHGAAGNRGNRSALCRDEQDFTLDLGRAVASELEQTGGFEVRLSRGPGQIVDYHERVRLAERWGAEAFVSLHSDVRGPPERWAPEPGKTCLRSHAAPGFSVLWSDEGAGGLTTQRRKLAVAVASRLVATGLLAYQGADYRDDYTADVEQRGVFVDRHPEAKRIFVLRAPTMPSIIVETHNARDEREARRWQEPATRHAFARALCAALLEAMPPRGR